MDQISKIDKNFEVKTNFHLPNVRYYSALESPFSLHGVFNKDGSFRRMPEEVAKSASDSVHRLHTHTAGGRLRFRLCGLLFAQTRLKALI